MKKLFSILIAVILLTACDKSYPAPILEKSEYEVIQILSISRNGFEQIMSYHVIIEDKSGDLYYAKLNRQKDVYYIKFGKLNLKRIE